jgi:hypothetical protein
MTDRLIAILTARAKGLGITVDEQPASAAHGAWPFWIRTCCDTNSLSTEELPR